MCECVSVFVCVCECVSVFVCVCECVCVRECVCIHIHVLGLHVHDARPWLIFVPYVSQTDPCGRSPHW